MFRYWLLYKEPWYMDVEYVSEGDWRILGEDEHGSLYVPSRTRWLWLDRKFNKWNPFHWKYYLRSRLTRRIAFLE